MKICMIFNIYDYCFVMREKESSWILFQNWFMSWEQAGFFDVWRKRKACMENKNKSQNWLQIFYRDKTEEVIEIMFNDNLSHADRTQRWNLASLLMIKLYRDSWLSTERLISCLYASILITKEPHLMHVWFTLIFPKQIKSQCIPSS